MQSLGVIALARLALARAHREAALAAMRALAFVFLYLAAAAHAPVVEQKASGRRRLFSREQVAKLTASGGFAIDGDTLVVGDSEASCEDGATNCLDSSKWNEAGGAGAAYVFRTSDGGATYDQVAKLTAADAKAWDHFGTSVAIAGSTIVVTASDDDDGGSKSGSVYVFRTTDDGATYSQVAKLTAADAAMYDFFGYSVAIDGATAVVGAMGDGVDGGDDDAGDRSGAAYVFLTTDNGATYGQVAKLVASDVTPGDYFGWSVAIDGNTIVVGANKMYNGDPGAAYVFRTSDGGATYDQVAKLMASDAADGDDFGQSVAIDGDTVMIGASQYHTGPGAVYVFRTSDGGSTYSQVAKLTASDAAMHDLFGGSVAIDGGTVVVGARFEDDGGSQSGAVYVFRESASTYVEVAKLTAADAAADDNFGQSVAISGDTVVVGAWNDGGSAYVFSPPAPTMQPTVQPTPRPTWTFQPTAQPTTPQPSLQPVPRPTPAPTATALGSDSATRAGGTLLALVAIVLAL